MFSPARRAKAARILMFMAIPAWPITQITVASGEPPFTLALSWLALIISLADVAATTDVRDKTD